ncbi:MAG TPA: hypothetical protein VHY57_04275, partial [Rhizomicrobium sp.]|nr:hypothetical protein [Rhizomicrobium sp.]
MQSPHPAFPAIHHAPDPADRTARLAAGLLTSVLYVLFALLFWRSFLIAPALPARPEITARLLADVADKKLALPPPPLPFIAHMIRPKAEDMAMPQFTVQPERTSTQAALPTVAPVMPSPLRGGAQTQDTPGQPVSATGSNGNASATTG